MFLKVFYKRKFTKFYSKSTLEQTCFSLIQANKQCQLSSSRGTAISSESDDVPMHTSLVPYKLIDKDMIQRYDLQKSNSFTNVEFLFCLMKTSPHFQNIAGRDEAIPNLLSFSFGQNQFVEEFSKINLYSPRCLRKKIFFFF